MPKPEQSRPTYTAEDLELARMIIESESPASYPSVPPELLSSQPMPEPAPPPPPIVGKPWSDEEQILRDARVERQKEYKRYFGPGIQLDDPYFKRTSLEDHYKQSIPRLHDDGTEAEAPDVVATESVALPAMQPEEEATAAADDEVAPTPEAPTVTVPGEGALAQLGTNAVAQAAQRAEVHKLEAGRRMDEAEAREAAETTKKERIVEWKGKLGRLEDELQYFGMDRDDVHAAQALLEKEPEPNWTLDERQNLLRKQALAKAQLQSARTINTMGPFKHMASKFLAALSVGAGSWAAVRTGRNPAMELYKGAIERDIAAQKSAYARKADRVTRHVNTYDRIQSEIGDELTSTLLMASKEYGAAEQQVMVALEQLKGQEQKLIYQKQAEELRATKFKLQDEAQKAFLRKKLEVDRSRDIGVLGVTYVGRQLPDGTYDTGMVPDKQEVKKIKEAGAAYKKYMKRIAALMQYAGKISWLGDLDRKRRAKYAWEDIISLAGNLHEKGVLQEFERKTLEAVFPEPGGIIDNLGLLKPSLEEFQQRAKNDWEAFMSSKTHFRLDSSLGQKKWGVKARGQRK